MIRVNFDPDLLTGERAKEWLDWKRQADDATEQIISNWRRGIQPMITKRHETIYHNLRNWLLEVVFSEKCAYCERKMIKNKEMAAAEHYRPKLAVRLLKSEGGGRVLAIGPDGQAVDHPGYFWLALDWRNIVPSCAGCNALQGKLNQFPVSANHCYAVHLTAKQIATAKERHITIPGYQQLYFLTTEDFNNHEAPLLLHPYFDEPSEHLSIDKFGGITGISDRGKISISVFNLGEPGLRGEREVVWLDAELEVGMEVKRLLKVRVTREEAVRRVRTKLLADCTSSMEYAATYRAAIEQACSQLLDKPIGATL